MADPLFDAPEPFALFAAWFAEAKAAEVNDPDAMALATVDTDGLPDVRMVLLKQYGPEGFTFHTNAQSAKGRQFAANPRAALCLHWKSLRRQVRVRGPLEPVSEAESEAYFRTRSRDSRFSAIASQQSRPVENREVMLARVEARKAEYEGVEPPRPAHWGGWRVAPLAIEFWMDGPNRLHDRRLFTRRALGEAWESVRLWP